MANSRDSREKKSELPSTYFVQDRSSKEELIRLDAQDRLITAVMGGPLPELEDPGRLQNVLDVACGPGGWLIDLARTYPVIARLVGIDISGRMIAYAQEQARVAQVGDRVTFQVGDALRELTFPSDSFDLVHQRLGLSFIRTWEWPALLSEYQRVCKPGGIIHITEAAMLPQSNSPALTRLHELMIEALYRAGHFFTQESEGLARHLGDLMSRYGLEQVQTKVYSLSLLANPETQKPYAEDMQRLFRNTLPFMQKWIKIPADYQELYRQMVYELQRPDFVVTNMFTTAWGIKRNL